MLHTRLRLHFYPQMADLLFSSMNTPLHRLLMVLLSPNFPTLWLPNSIILPEKRPPASISLSGSELWAPYLILAPVASAACRSPPCQPFFPALLFPPTRCSLLTRRPLRWQFSSLSCRGSSASQRQCGLEDMADEKKQVNVISPGTPA